MATSNTGNGVGKKIGAVGAAAALLIVGVGGCNYLQGKDDSTSNQNLAREDDQSTTLEEDETVVPESSRDQDDEYDPTGEDSNEGVPDPDRGNPTERIIVNPDGTTSVVHVEDQASEREDASEGINPGDVEVPEDQPKNEVPSPGDLGDRGGSDHSPVAPSMPVGDNSSVSETDGSAEPDDSHTPDDSNNSNGGNGGTDTNGGVDAGGMNPNDPTGSGDGGDRGPGSLPESPGEKVNIQALIDYVNLQRNMQDANNDGGIWNDGVSTGKAPNTNLYKKNGGALVVVDDDGRPVGVIWNDMSQKERDSLLKDLSKYDETRIYGINRDDGKASIGIDQYILRNVEAKDDEFEVQKGGSITIKAKDLLENDRVLQDEGGLFGQNKGASNITDVQSKYEGIEWNPRTGEITVDTKKYQGDKDELDFEYTIQHDQDGKRNKSRNTSTSTGTVTVKVTRPESESGDEQEDMAGAQGASNLSARTSSATPTTEEDTRGSTEDGSRITPFSASAESSRTAAEKPEVATSGGDEPEESAEKTVSKSAGATDEARSAKSIGGAKSGVGRHSAVNADGSLIYSDAKKSSVNTNDHTSSNGRKSSNASVSSRKKTTAPRKANTLTATKPEATSLKKTKNQAAPAPAPKAEAPAPKKVKEQPALASAKAKTPTQESPAPDAQTKQATKPASGKPQSEKPSTHKK